MRVSDILKVKGNTLFTVTPDTPLRSAVDTMAEHDIGSLVVMEYGDLVRILTFREIILRLKANGGSIGEVLVRTVMDEPLTCTPETDIDEVRRMMLERHALHAGARQEGADGRHFVLRRREDRRRGAEFRNRMLKAYIRDWPEPDSEERKPLAS